jgi:tripartite-type tricarboxylate transporter receptor subunit TctC
MRVGIASPVALKSPFLARGQPARV